MKYGNYRDGFFLPNELFQLGLDYGELAVYSFLKRCENRKTHQCWPSIKTIGEAVGMSENTVRKYIRQLEERGLIVTEPTEVITKAGEKRNGNLLFHGCVPCNRDGSFMEFEVGKAVTLSGKAYFDYADRLARQGLLAPEGSEEREEGRDYLWYLWCGRNSPVFGRDHIATFERALIEDKATWKEPKNHYYSYTDEEEFCRKILHSFGCDKPWSRIVNGHVPVKAKEGESPLKGHGRLVVIDGGFCRAYQSQTGIAGYTMFFNSLGMRLAAHEPFTSIEDAMKNGRDITSHTFNVDELSHRVMVADIDTGEEIQSRIDDLMKLLEAFRDGIIKVDQAKAKQR